MELMNETTRLEKSLPEAFRSYAALERMLQHQFGVNLEGVAGRGPLQNVVHTLIYDWAKPLGKLNDLALGALRENPDNPDLQIAVLILLLTQTRLTLSQLRSFLRHGFPGEFERLGVEEPQNIADLIKTLADLRGQKLLIEFVLNIAREVHLPSMELNLKSWLECVAPLHDPQVNWPDEPPFDVLTVIFIPVNQDENRYRLQILGGFGQSYRKLGQPIDIQINPNQPHSHLLDQLGTYIWEQIYEKEQYDSIPLEFFLPLSLIALEVDQVGLPMPDDTRERVSYQHAVRVRSYDRAAKALLYARVRPRWERLHACGADQTAQARHAYITDKQQCIQEIISEIDEDTVCVGFGHLPSESNHLKELFGLMIRKGIPIALWTRCTHAKEILVNLLTNVGITGLPDHIHQQHRASCDADEKHIGHHLSLLWDDPDRKPTPNYFKYPE